MQPDSIKLKIKGRELNKFLSYQVTSDLFTAGDRFSFNFGLPPFDIYNGNRVKLYVNNQAELTGFIMETNKSSNINGDKMTIGGYDFLGLLNDSYVEEEYSTQEDIDLCQFVRNVLACFNYFPKVIYGKGNKNLEYEIAGKDSLMGIYQMVPGQTYFEAVKNAALAHGFLFWSRPNGTLIFGDPLEFATPNKEKFSLIRLKSGEGNILDGTENENIFHQFSRIYVSGQFQGIIDSSYMLENYQFPTGIHKPLVVATYDMAENPEKLAKIKMDNCKFRGYSLNYTVAHHSQNGHNWQPNSIVHVRDEKLKIKGNYLIYGRTFEMSEDHKTLTHLKLSRLGLNPIKLKNAKSY